MVGSARVKFCWLWLGERIHRHDTRAAGRFSQGAVAGGARRGRGCAGTPGLSPWAEGAHDAHRGRRGGIVTVAFSTDQIYFAHQPPGGVQHPERSDRLASILQQLDTTGLLDRMDHLPERDATDEELLAVHTRDLLVTVDAPAAAGGGWADPDTFIGPSSPAASRRVAGATLAATEAVLDGSATSAFVAARPPGHHA
ncbi:MAG: hypothetical protein F4Y98_07005, partial [Chloroflexi bacterium]|nr:hypothetical protein [Chloroflexota bacterium]